MHIVPSLDKRPTLNTCHIPVLQHSQCPDPASLPEVGIQVTSYADICPLQDPYMLVSHLVRRTWGGVRDLSDEDPNLSLLA